MMSKAKPACGDDTDLSSWNRPLFRFIHFYVRANNQYASAPMNRNTLGLIVVGSGILFVVARYF
jgi:hypothetical protein